MSPELRHSLLFPVRAALGLTAACLPVRKWNEWDGDLPVRAMAAPAAIVTLLLGFAIGIPGFLRYAESMGGTVADAVLESSELVNMGRKPPEAPAYTWFAMMLAVPAFAFFTPLGLLATYLVGSGSMRAICCAADDPRGDLLLTLGDRAWRWTSHRFRMRRLVAARAALEGQEVPDVLVSGRAVATPDAAFAIIASRLKDGWEPGVFLLTSEGRYRIGERFDRRFPDGLRAIYPLIEVPAAEATRRRISASLPPLSDLDPVTRQVRSAR